MASYSIGEMEELTGIKAHVLRYWEEELHLPIKRNELPVLPPRRTWVAAVPIPSEISRR